MSGEGSEVAEAQAGSRDRRYVDPGREHHVVRRPRGEVVEARRAEELVIQLLDDRVVKRPGRGTRRASSGSRLAGPTRCSPHRAVRKAPGSRPRARADAHRDPRPWHRAARATDACTCRSPASRRRRSIRDHRYGSWGPPRAASTGASREASRLTKTTPRRPWRRPSRAARWSRGTTRRREPGASEEPDALHPEGDQSDVRLPRPTCRDGSRRQVGLHSLGATAQVQERQLLPALGEDRRRGARSERGDRLGLHASRPQGGHDLGAREVRQGAAGQQQLGSVVRRRPGSPPARPAAARRPATASPPAARRG